MRKVKRALIAATLLAGIPSAASASTSIYWTDITAGSPGSVTGTVATPQGSTSVSYSGDYNHVRTSGHEYVWSGNAYTFGGENHAPTSGDYIGLTAATTHTIDFGAAVTNVYLAFASLNDQILTFSQPFQVISTGGGTWGSGTYSIVGGTMSTNSEFHGILQFAGPISSLSFTTNNYEHYSLLQVGVGGLAVASVPEPSTWAMMLIGFGGIGFAMRRSKSAQARLQAA